MPVAAEKLIRKMRGGAQAWLIQAATGDTYVVKFRENAQHRRILINEWIASCFLEQLGLCAAKTSLMHFSLEWLEQASKEGLSIALGNTQRAISPGLHLGSKVAVDPGTTAIYDYLPDAILRDVRNRNHFHGMLAFDQWTTNADARQAVFFRGRFREFLPEGDFGHNQRGFVAMMIDHGYCFQGPDWRLEDLPRQGTFVRPAAYEQVTGWNDFEPWLTRILHFPDSAVDRALSSIPSSWLEDGEEALLEKLMMDLLRRRQRAPDLLEACRNARPDFFPNWNPAPFAPAK
ncbi:MAG: hypothetical protein IT170_15665 [Bryobacterales bacterium]|nr:hypothetical protein [Bryobacterales bacterium]